MPADLNAAYTKPEQSYEFGPCAPQTYGLRASTCVFAYATAAARMASVERIEMRPLKPRSGHTRNCPDVCEAIFAFASSKIANWRCCCRVRRIRFALANS